MSPIRSTATKSARCGRSPTRWRCSSDPQRSWRRAVRASQRQRARSRRAARWTGRAPRLSPSRIRPARAQPHAGVLRSARRRPVAGAGATYPSGGANRSTTSRRCGRSGSCERLAPLRLFVGRAARDAVRGDLSGARRVARAGLACAGRAARAPAIRAEPRAAERYPGAPRRARARSRRAACRSHDIAGIQPATLRTRRRRILPRSGPRP